MADVSANVYFSIVVLTYGSGRSLIPLIEKLHRMLSQMKFSWEIILVGNYLEGKQDETPQVVRELAEKLDHVRFVAQPKKGMAGWDVRSGLDIAKGKYIGFIDGDGQMPLGSIFTCLEKIDKEKLDLVKTYRISREDGFYRRAISNIYNKLFRLMFKIKVQDVNSNPKILLRSKYELMNLRSDDWFIDAEMMLRAEELGLKVGEVPMKFLALEDRESFVDLGTIFEFLRNMLRYKLSKSPSKNQSALI
jgi:glycosyltransferase involved in cell wall biosynthesis